MRTVETEYGPITVCGTFVANDLMPDGVCVLLGHKNGLPDVLWYGRFADLPADLFHEAESVIVHPAAFERIKARAAELEKGIPYEPEAATHGGEHGPEDRRQDSDQSGEG